MKLTELFETVRQRGIELIPECDLLRYRAPEGALDEALKAELRQHKQEILTALKKRMIGGHEVAEVIWATDAAIIFQDPEGDMWRYLHTYGQTWPVTVVEGVQ